MDIVEDRHEHIPIRLRALVKTAMEATSMRATIVFAFLFASACAAEGGDLVPSPVDAGEEKATPVDAGADVGSTDREPDRSAEAGPPDVSIDLDWPDPDAFVRWDYTYSDERKWIYIYDARGPDGECFIPPGPWTSTDPDTGLSYCLYPPDHPARSICECIWGRFYPEGGIDRDR